MEYPIYTYGGGELLVMVFNAVGMLFKSDNTYLTPVGTWAMTLGGVYIGIKATFKADIALLVKSWMLPSLIAFMFLFSPKTTVWIKDEATGAAGINIANIPFGIAFFASISSGISHHLSKLLEETMLPAGRVGATHTGILYGARAMAKLRDVQIQDPILLQNTKEYMRQCYMKPYVMGNFGGNKSEAIRTTDILGFLALKPAKCFGIKPVMPDGSIGKFITCAEAGINIRRDIEAHSRSPLLIGRIGAALGLSGKDQGLTAMRIKSMVADTAGFLDQKQLDVHEWVKQAMMLNANRESYDDWRQKAGLERVFPELVKMQATRGMFHQAFGSIIGAEMAESMIPAAAQPVMLALVVMTFVIILPFALLPGGWQYIITGAKLMIWVCTWPVFYTIIHAIAMIQLKNSIGAWGEGGLSLIGQGGFTELILWKYAAVQSLITSVPFISFAIVFGSPYALSSIAGAVAGTGGSMAIGASMADGNISMGQRSYNTLTKNQENHTPSLTMGGGIIDDGTMRVQSDGSGGQIITEHQDNMAVNYNTSDSISGSLSASLSNAKTDLASISDRESTQTGIVDSQAVDVARAVARGTTQASNLSISDIAALKRGFGLDKSATTTDSAGENNSTVTSSHLEAKVPGLVTAATGLSGGTGTSAANSADVRKDMSAQERQAFNTALDKVKNAAKTDSLTTNNSDDTRLNSAFGANLSKQEQIARDKAKTLQNVDTLSSQLSYVEQNAGTINRNANQEVMNAVMRQNPNLGSKEQAARWMRTHRAETDAIARPIIGSYNPFASTSSWGGTKREMAADTGSGIISKLDIDGEDTKNTEIADESSLQNKFRGNAAKVRSRAVTTDSAGKKQPLEKVVADNTSGSNVIFDNDAQKMLEKNLNSEEQTKLQELELHKGKYEDRKKDIEKAKEDTYDSTIVRGIEEVGNNSTKLINKIAGEEKKNDSK